MGPLPYQPYMLAKSKPIDPRPQLPAIVSRDRRTSYDHIKQVPVFSQKVWNHLDHVMMALTFQQMTNRKQ